MSFDGRRARANANHRLRALILSALISVAPVLASDAPVPTIADAYINQRGNVVVVEKDGRRTVITSQGGCERIAVAKDGRTVAWSRSTRKGSAVFIFRGGIVRKIDGDPFVREFWFVDGGRKIAVESGGMHFAGWETLYDVVSLERIAEFNQSTTPISERPSWSTSSEIYNGD